MGRTIENVHERALPASPEQVGALIDSLASPDDRLWPTSTWPAMRFARPLSIGADGGHGPVRYRVERYDRGRSVWFRFTAPAGFFGVHGYEVVPAAAGSVLRHSLRMRIRGPALLTWPLLFRPLHDALIEDSLDRAECEVTGVVRRPARWSLPVRVLRRAFRRRHRSGVRRPA